MNTERKPWRVPEGWVEPVERKPWRVLGGWVETVKEKKGDISWECELFRVQDEEMIKLKRESQYKQTTFV